MFLQSLVNLIILFQSETLPPNSRKDKKKSFCCILVLSQSRISDFLLPSGYYLPKSEKARYISLPSVSDARGAAPQPPKIGSYEHTIPVTVNS